jgi:hypothetical protein
VITQQTAMEIFAVFMMICVLAGYALIWYSAGFLTVVGIVLMQVGIAVLGMETK